MKRRETTTTAAESEHMERWRARLANEVQRVRQAIGSGMEIYYHDMWGPHPITELGLDEDRAWRPIIWVSRADSPRKGWLYLETATDQEDWDAILSQCPVSQP